MRIEWYRNIRRRHDEIEEMASRPFASIQLDLGGDSMKSVNVIRKFGFLFIFPLICSLVNI